MNYNIYYETSVVGIISIPLNHGDIFFSFQHFFSFVFITLFPKKTHDSYHKTSKDSWSNGCSRYYVYHKNDNGAKGNARPMSKYHFA